MVFRNKGIDACYVSAAISGPMSLATRGALTSATLATTCSVTCGGTIPGPTSIATSGALTCASIAATGPKLIFNS